jgi:hypothetical protein
LSNRTAVPLLVGAATEPIEVFPYEVSIREGSAAESTRHAESSIAHLWIESIESQQDASESVDMRRADRRRLKALGYIVD